MLKEFLSRKNIKYRERDVAADYAAGQELISRSGQRGVPVTFVDGQMIVGFDQARLEHVLAASHGPSFGAAVADAARITASRGLPAATGAYVGAVRPSSAAQRLGLAPGDIIVEVNSRSVATAADLEQAFGGLSSGARLIVVFLRGGTRHAAEGTL